MRRRSALACLLAGLLLAALAAVAPARAQDTNAVVVFAAASLKNALDAVIADFGRENTTQVKASYAASSALAKQMEGGAPADVFISADTDWMDYVEGKKLIAGGTRQNLLGNDLVLVAAKDAGMAPVAISKGFDLAALLKGGRLAVGQVDSVPAGKYAKAALTYAGSWDGVSGQLAQADNVRAALALVAAGEAPLGIVYKTDAAAEPRVAVVGTFPADSHPPIIYPMAVTDTGAKKTAAGAFLAYLKGGTAQKAFEKEGFTVLKFNRP